MCAASTIVIIGENELFHVSGKVCVHVSNSTWHKFNKPSLHSFSRTICRFVFCYTLTILRTMVRRSPTSPPHQSQIELTCVFWFQNYRVVFSISRPFIENLIRNEKRAKTAAETVIASDIKNQQIYLQPIRAFFFMDKRMKSMCTDEIGIYGKTDQTPHQQQTKRTFSVYRQLLLSIDKIMLYSLLQIRYWPNFLE